MALDGFFAEGKLLGDVAVAAAFNDAADHLKFPWCEAVGLALRHGGLLHEVVESGDEIDDALAADPVVSGNDGANGGLKMAGEGILENNAARADVQGLNDLLSGDRGSKKQDFRRGGAVHDGAHGFEAGHARHGNVEKQNVGLFFERLGNRFIAVGGVANNIETLSFSEHVAHAYADDRMVIRQHNSDGSFHLSGLPPRARITANDRLSRPCWFRSGPPHAAANAYRIEAVAAVRAVSRRGFRLATQHSAYAPTRARRRANHGAKRLCYPIGYPWAQGERPQAARRRVPPGRLPPCRSRP